MEIEIPISSLKLTGELLIPENSIGIVVFSHGSGSSRFSPRNMLVAELLQKNNIGTFLFDLLTEEEDAVYENRFNIDLLTKRLIDTTKSLMNNVTTKNLPIAYFGASTGAASALKAAAYFGESIKAVVSRGGRPDLVMNELHNVKAPVLLIVGQLDLPVIELNKRAFEHLNSIKELKIIPGATHLFEESGKLEKVAELSIQWYKKYFVD
ncbi:MAG: hypothetical protein RI883_598 [Bacteroidota bacterium]|jgi:pimeloyl-ACP methyl ester carboxylesterase